MSEKLKACPKCRSPIPPWVIRHEDRDGTINGWYVECEQCSLTCGKLFGTEEEAIDNWNTRHNPRCGDCKHLDATGACSELYAKYFEYDPSRYAEDYKQVCFHHRPDGDFYCAKFVRRDDE